MVIHSMTSNGCRARAHCVAIVSILLTSLTALDASAQNVVVQQPTFGVSVDAKGVLTAKAFPGGRELILARINAAKANLNEDVVKPSKLRYVSLRRLDQAIRQRTDDGLQPTDEMFHLAGLLRVEFVFALPDQKDIVLAGPAEGWIESPAGHDVGIQSGLPVLQLEDLTTALHVFAEGRPANQWVGCSIGPAKGAMAKLQAFNRTIPRTIREGQEQAYSQRILAGTIQSLGMAGVVTFGVDSDTHMGKRMIEADYRMKAIGIGAEPPPIKMQTFYSQIKSPPKSILQRWWLVPDYERIGISEDRLAARFVGAGIKLLTENYQPDGKGGMKKSNQKPSGASQAYTKSFTRNFEKIALMSSSFGQLRNAVDLLVTAAFLRSEGLYKKSGFLPDWIHNLKIDYKMTARITNAPCLINSKWKGRRFFTLAGGGVSIVPGDALKPENLIKFPVKDFKLNQPVIKKEQPAWWWDR